MLLANTYGIVETATNAGKTTKRRGSPRPNAVV
jgi:hypothetical protein